MKDSYDIIIIGGGAMGLSSAAALANTEKKVLVLEQFGFFNQKGSSAGMSRQFRVQYAQKYMAQLALDAIPYWEELQKHSGDTLVDKVGSLWFGDPSISSQEGGIQAAEEVMKELDIPFTPMNAKEIEAKFPFKNLPEDYTGFFQKDGGIINLSATLQTLFNIANKASNIDLIEYNPVTNIDSRKKGNIKVFTEKNIFTAEKLILTPGSYINDVLKHFGLSVNVDIWEMSSAYYKNTGNVQLPTWFVFQKPQSKSLFYGFPEVNWSHPGYIRVAPDIPDQIINDPSDRTGIPSIKSLGYNSEWVMKHMEGLEPNPEFTSTCLITLNNNNKELMVDTLPEWVHNHEDIVVYTGGWAAKFIPLLGNILADLAVTGKTKYDLSHFKIEWPLVRGEISNRFDTKVAKNLKLDVAIVGAGASGLYSGYRLKNGKDQNGNSLDLDINIFEMSDRVGGRLESIKLPGMNVVGEIGGMRYMTSQKIVTSLIEDVFATQYALDPIPFPMGDPDHHLYYLRKQRFFANRFSQAKITGENFKTHYEVGEKFQGKSSDEIFRTIIKKVLKKGGHSLKKIQNSPSPRREWNKVKKELKYEFKGPYKGKYVYEIGFWNMLKDQSSQECYEFLAQAGGYYSNTINWNAAEAMPYMVGDFASDSVEYKTIDGGYDQILTCLADDFLQNGGKIRTKNRLASFEKNPDTTSVYKYILTFYNMESKEYWKVDAKDIILSMPRRSLELLDQDNFFFNRDKQKALQHNLKSVIMEPSCKILLGFEEPWWKETLGAQAGESITDLPMRQCYYFGVDPKNSHSLFLSSYNDMRTVQFWKALDNGEKFQTKTTKLVKGKNFLYPHYEHASKMMVEEVIKQVRDLHGPSISVPDPYTSAFKDWTLDPYGGGYHAWKNHYKVWEIMPYIRQPHEEERVFITGEAYSDQQGWVEGAFCVAEHVMREKYNLACPDWLNEDYYLGW
ncbi:FAD-dependent oxidoreductase [Echinicola jeungdonensis]|uniref:FAD-dependent oxidoreductase n=1 Tax=Echinicola jeungdonensis TaxID=709343 RepID=A0ABV5JB60_9BACT|nr:FAD-dependent oxidoreductase [Echinicola jeungdonensis]MDN3670497.1 FAD-dependent oxidoreductase [Echinicola jeungdonensis]